MNRTHDDTVHRSGDLALLDREDSSRTDTTDAPQTAGTRRGGSRRRTAIIIGSAVLVAFSAIGGVTAAAMSRSVTVTVDGQSQEITTVASSVDGVLSAAGIDVGEHDVVAPAETAEIADGGTIAVERAHLLTLTIDGEERQVWTTADTVEAALLEMGQDPAALQLSADRSRALPADGLAVTASTLRSVSLSIGGAPAESVSTGARTVADLLADENVQLSATDTVDPALDTPLSAGLPVTVTRVVVTPLTDTYPIPAGEQRVDDPSKNVGTDVVAQQGVDGVLQVVTDVTAVNGVETGRAEASRTILAEPVPTIVHVGTTSTVEHRGSRVFFNDTEFGVNWDGLAFCESTNNPAAVNNPSGYLSTYGLFQFDLPTWGSVGGTGNPLDASPEEQLLRAKLLFQQRGLEPWLCGYAASSPPPA